MNIKILLFFLIIPGLLICQQKWAGNYEGIMKGESVVLTLSESGNNSLAGKMTDAANTYEVSGTVSGNNFSGHAVERNFGISFEMTSTLKGQNLPTILAIDVFGTIQKIEINFMRSGSGIKNPGPPINKPAKDKNKDKNVCGLWVKESNYNSGYGDSYGAMSFSESIEFVADGTMTEGGSQAVISGSNYSGISSSGQKKILECVQWYTENQKIYLIISQNGHSQTVELGKYYIENNKMLITGSNGQKLLLSKR